MATKQQPPFKVLIFPWLAHGHVFPFLELAKTLDKKNFDVHFCSTPINLDSIKKSKYLPVSIELIELHLPSSPELPPQYHTTKNIPPHLFQTLMAAFQMSSSKFSDIIKDLKPDLLIYDGFQPWAAKIATSAGIPSVLFATSGAAALSFFHHLHTHKNLNTFPYPSIYLNGHELRDLFALSKSMKVEGNSEEAFHGGIFSLSSEIVLIKSFKGFEDKYMDYLSTLCGKRLVPVGPRITNVSDDQESDSDIIKWLNKKDQDSTLYISFGSENYFSSDQIEEIAKGLEICEVNFIWVIRLPSGNDVTIEELLPEGFLEKVKDRGIVTQEWAPQAEILGHKSVGGFMSHCGWGSVSESVYFAVPIICVPLKVDQPVNSRLVEETGVGLGVKKDGNGKFKGEDVAKAINWVISGESGEGFRCKVKELSEKMKMEEEATVDEVARELLNICEKTVI